MEYAQWWEPHLHWFWILLLLVMILMFVRVVSGVRRWRAGSAVPFGCCAPWRRSEVRRRADTPQRILDRRYASGEITKEEYERIGRDIASTLGEDGRRSRERTSRT